MVDFIKLILSAEILESGRVIGIIMPFAFLLIFLGSLSIVGVKKSDEKIKN